MVTNSQVINNFKKGRFILVPIKKGFLCQSKPKKICVFENLFSDNNKLCKRKVSKKWFYFKISEKEYL